MSEAKKGAESGFNVDLGGMLKGLGDFVEKLSDLAEKGERLSREAGRSDGLNMVYGWSVKVGSEGESGGVKVEPFGNVARSDADTDAEAAVHETREPPVDVFEEAGEVLVVAEMPGVGEEHLQLHLEGDILELRAERGRLRYAKEILLPRPFTSEQMSHSANNGIVEVRLKDS